MKLLDSMKAFFEVLNSEVFKVNNQMIKFERRIEMKIKRIKRSFKNTLLNILFLFLAVCFLSAGLVVFLARYLPYDVIFLIFGGVFALLALIFYILE